jgi:hypothetical protein
VTDALAVRRNARRPENRMAAIIRYA